MENSEIIYQLTIEDLQTVANEYLERDLTKEEISLVTDKLGDYINWYDSIECAIESTLNPEHSNEN